MDETCLFIKIRTVEGKRDVVKKLWEKDQKQRANKNEYQTAYFYCYDKTDPDVICIFEHYIDTENLEANARSDWFLFHMKEVLPYLDGTPEVSYTTPIWIK